MQSNCQNHVQKLMQSSCNAPKVTRYQFGLFDDKNSVPQEIGGPSKHVVELHESDNRKTNQFIRNPKGCPCKIEGQHPYKLRYNYSSLGVSSANRLPEGGLNYVCPEQRKSPLARIAHTEQRKSMLCGWQKPAIGNHITQASLCSNDPCHMKHKLNTGIAYNTSLKNLLGHCHGQQASSAYPFKNPECMKAHPVLPLSPMGKGCKVPIGVAPYNYIPNFCQELAEERMFVQQQPRSGAYRSVHSVRAMC